MPRADILLVDDDRAFADSLVALLSDESISVDCAAEWDEGIARFRGDMHELVVADFNLPGSRHGLQLLSTVKSLKPTSRLILISGALLPEAEDVVARTDLVDRYLVKDDRLADEVLAEARDAVSRGNAKTDWEAVARANVDAGRLYQPDIDAIDNLLRLQIRND